MWVTSTLAQAHPLFPRHFSRSGLCVGIVFSIIKGCCSAGGIPTAVCDLPTKSYVKCMCTTTFSARNPLESLGIPWNPPTFGPGIPAKVPSAHRSPKAEHSETDAKFTPNTYTYSVAILRQDIVLQLSPRSSTMSSGHVPRPGAWGGNR